MEPVTTGDIAHGGEYVVSRVRERLRSVASEAAASSGEKDGLRHDELLPLGKGLHKDASLYAVTPELLEEGQAAATIPFDDGALN
jgi:hypothetical protein